MAFEIIGKIIDISPVNQVSDKFKKREFVIEKKESGGAAVFIDYIKFQLIQDKCDLINDSFLNEDVRIWFNLKGNKCCLLYTSPSPRDRTRSRMPSSA